MYGLEARLKVDGRVAGCGHHRPHVYDVHLTGSFMDRIDAELGAITVPARMEIDSKRSINTSWCIECCDVDAARVECANKHKLSESIIIRIRVGHNPVAVG